ncbi:hypothetical protein Vretifemale_1863, partial [Volvox reticuliferus]
SSSSAFPFLPPFFALPEPPADFFRRGFFVSGSGSASSTGGGGGGGGRGLEPTSGSRQRLPSSRVRAHPRAVFPSGVNQSSTSTRSLTLPSWQITRVTAPAAADTSSPSRVTARKVLGVSGARSAPRSAPASGAPCTATPRNGGSGAMAVSSAGVISTWPSVVIRTICPAGVVICTADTGWSRFFSGMPAPNPPRSSSSSSSSPMSSSPRSPALSASAALMVGFGNPGGEVDDDADSGGAASAPFSVSLSAAAAAAAAAAASASATFGSTKWYAVTSAPPWTDARSKGPSFSAAETPLLSRKRTVVGPRVIVSPPTGRGPLPLAASRMAASAAAVAAVATPG